MRTWMYWGIFSFLLLAAFFCLLFLLLYFTQIILEKEEYATMAYVVDNQFVQDLSVPETDSIEDSRLTIYRELSKRNPDMVGWIRIDGTTIDYPVMQTPENPNYYLYRNFDKEYSHLGTPYIQADCDLEASDNLIFHGHHMLTGGMFSDLDLYKDEEFWIKHPTIQFDTLTECAEYEIFAVIQTVVTTESGFQCYQFTVGNRENYEAHVEFCKELALYETGIDPQYGERLITLSTCEYSHENGRLLVVARKKIGGSK